MPEDWCPTPFREFVLKVHSRCNLACSYCYMYELGDRSWRGASAVMSDRVVDQASVRIGEHARAHQTPAVRVILHGGEPLLVGAAGLARVAARMRANTPSLVDVLIQTNGVLLNERSLDVLQEAGIRIGISLDGDRQANDRYRLYANGHSSYDAVRRALDLLQRRPGLLAGILAVIDPANDPLEIYEALLDAAPSSVDFLLPHANWSSLPPAWSGGRETPYGDWLVAVFDRWYDAPVRETRVRFFENLISLVVGGQSRTETIGLNPVATIVIDVEGAYEQVDTLRSTYPGAVDTGLNVFDNTLDEALRHPDIIARQIGVAALSETCLSCSIHRVCGAGHYPHRYHQGSGFKNPSVYCADLRRIILHVAGRVRADVRRRKEKL
jgi:uncharacterized protein